VDAAELKARHVVPDSVGYQIYSRLRSEIAPSSQLRDGMKLIENDGASRYRLSIHPDFVNCDWKTLREHKDARIAELARQLPRPKKRR